MEKEQKTIVEYDSRGSSGNIFVVLFAVRAVMIKEHREDEFNSLWDDITKTQSYEEALELINKHVTTVDISAKAESEM